MDEFELKFLEINVAQLEDTLQKLDFQFKGEEFLEEWLYWRPEWKDFRGRVRLRDSGKLCTLAYKETNNGTGDGNVEIEFEVNDKQMAKQFLDKVIGKSSARHQQKRRRSYFTDQHDVVVDIDFWPQLPPYIEIEGKNRDSIELVAKQLGFDLSTAVEKDALQIYEEIYHISLKDVRELVFD